MSEHESDFLKELEKIQKEQANNNHTFFEIEIQEEPSDKTSVYTQVPNIQDLPPLEITPNFLEQFIIYKVAQNKELTEYKIAYIHQRKEHKSSKQVVEGILGHIHGEFFRSIWQKEGGSGRAIGYGWKKIQVEAHEDMFYIDVPIESESEYGIELEKLENENILIIDDQCESLDEYGKEYEEYKKMKKHPELEPRTQTVMNELNAFWAQWYAGEQGKKLEEIEWIRPGSVWKKYRTLAEFYARTKHDYECEQFGKDVLGFVADLGIAAVGLANVPGAAFGSFATTAGKSILGNFIDIKDFRESYLDWVNTFIYEYLDNQEGAELENETTYLLKYSEWMKTNKDELESAFWVLSDYKKSQEFYGGGIRQEMVNGIVRRRHNILELNKGAFDFRNREILSLLPLIDIIIQSQWVPKDVESGEILAAGGLFGYWKNHKNPPIDLKQTVRDLIKTLMEQPNPLIMAYEFVESQSKSGGSTDFPEGLRRSKVISLLNKHVDQTHWQFAPNEKALKLWSTIFNMTTEDFKRIAPEESFIRLKDSYYDEEFNAIEEWLENNNLVKDNQSYGDAWLELINTESFKRARSSEYIPSSVIESTSSIQESSSGILYPDSFSSNYSTSSGGVSLMLMPFIYGVFPSMQSLTQETVDNLIEQDNVYSTPSLNFDSPSQNTFFPQEIDTPQYSFASFTPPPGADGASLPPMVPPIAALGMSGAEGGPSRFILDIYDPGISGMFEIPQAPEIAPPDTPISGEYRVPIPSQSNPPVNRAAPPVSQNVNQIVRMVVNRYQSVSKERMRRELADFLSRQSRTRQASNQYV